MVTKMANDNYEIISLKIRPQIFDLCEKLLISNYMEGLFHNYIH